MVVSVLLETSTFLDPSHSFSFLTRNLSTVVTDPEDPRFDLEKLIAKWEKESL